VVGKGVFVERRRFGLCRVLDGIRRFSNGRIVDD